MSRKQQEAEAFALWLDAHKREFFESRMMSGSGFGEDEYGKAWGRLLTKVISEGYTRDHFENEDHLDGYLASFAMQEASWALRSRRSQGRLRNKDGSTWSSVIPVSILDEDKGERKSMHAWYASVMTTTSESPPPTPGHWVWSLWLKLTPREKETLQLMELEDVPQRIAAEMMGTKPSAAGILRCQAINKLRRLHAGKMKYVRKQKDLDQQLSPCGDGMKLVDLAQQTAA